MMHSSPIVSVLVPTYNRVPFLDACLDSVLAQDFDGFEIVISDDASDDEATWDLCQEYGHCDRRIRLVRNPTNLGVVNNVRRCLAEARAPIAKFMLSDDLLYPGALTALVEPLLDDRSLVAVTSKWNMIDGHDGQIPLTAEWDLGVYDDRLFGPDDLGNTILMRFCNLIGTPSQVAFRRDRLDPARIDRVADQVFPLVFDVVMWLRLLREGPLLFRGDRCLSAFRIHDASIGVRNAVRVLLELWRLQRAARSLGYLSTAEKQQVALIRFLELATGTARALTEGSLAADDAERRQDLLGLGRAVSEADSLLQELVPVVDEGVFAPYAGNVSND